MSSNIYTTILKNNTGSTITIPDLSGLEISASGQINVTELFPFIRLADSEDLEGYVTSSGIVLNIDGHNLSVDRALVYLSHKDATHIQGIPVGDSGGGIDTSSVSGNRLVKFKKATEEFALEELEFLELSDTPTTYSGKSGQSAVVNNTEDGLEFTYPELGTTATGTIPPVSGTTNLWYNNEDHQLYYWDATRDNWLSVMSHYYMWTYKGAADGTYMSIGNLTHSSAYYYIPQPATIIGIISSAQKSQNSSKSFEIITAAVGTLLTFNHINWVHRDSTINIDLSEEDEVKCYVSSAGQSVRNSIVTLEIKWRYEA